LQPPPPPLLGPLGPQDALLQSSETARSLFFTDLRFACPVCSVPKLIQDNKPYHKGVWNSIMCHACHTASASHRWACPCNLNWRNCPIHYKWIFFSKKTGGVATRRERPRISSAVYLSTQFTFKKRGAGTLGGGSTASSSVKLPRTHSISLSSQDKSTKHNIKRKSQDLVSHSNPGDLFRGMSASALAKMPRLASRFGHLLPDNSSRVGAQSSGGQSSTPDLPSLGFSSSEGSTLPHAHNVHILHAGASLTQANLGERL
jgi:hypothetical protein